MKRFLIGSYQSYLCNLYIKKRVDEGLFSKILIGDIAKKHDTEGLFLVENLEEESKRFDNKEISFTAPLYGRDMKQAEKESKDLEDSIIENIDTNKLGSGNRRLGRLLIEDIKISESEEGFWLEFSLTKGAFATIVLREIMKND